MHNWFTCKVSYEKTMENGMQKKVCEPYLVDALSFTEAENRIIEEIRPYISGEFSVSDIRRTRLTETIFGEDGDKFYIVKVNFITLDEKTGAEKLTLSRNIVKASNLKEAIKMYEDFMKDSLADYYLVEVKETAIVDYFIYDPDSNNKIEDK